ncbi:MAG: DUF4230 domain-containing protein [Spirochaetales bacterium]|uniref:DUF4230 domain-containing protein n=1 Tax=Candidatus Thalassospirochaeta sargassi TaxID=3119039 RepID=A0AAJ1IC26_9SPIO|nr:DUF4230 domain-containing protein [Spirochaetales bacterium]
MKKRLIPGFLLSFFLILLFSCGQKPAEYPADELEISVREILELPVYEQVYRDIVYIGEEEKVLFFTTTDKEVLFSVDIRIQAGIKHAEQISISLNAASESGQRTVMVNLPKSEIIFIDADESSIEQYFIKEKGEDISRLEYYDEINRKKEELVQTAIESGLLEYADLNAEKLIGSFLKLAGFETVQFRRFESEN